MMKAVWSGVAAAVMIVGVSSAAYAQATDNKSINVTVNVNARAKLTLGTATVTFADADPDVTPTLTSAAITIDVKSRSSAAGAVTLTMQAAGDLVSGTDTIAISNLSWTASGTGFVGGTASTATAQTVGSWTGPGNPSGSHTLSLPNSWAYAIGSYTATLNYTLSAP